MKKVWVIFSLVFIGLFLASVFGGKPRDISADGGVGTEAQDHEVTNEMLQFTAGGHVLGFRKGEMFVASGDHALKIEFVGARSVSPMEEGTQDTGNSRQSSKPLEKVSYRNLWGGVTLVYEKHSSGLLESTYYIQPAGDGAANPVEHIRLRYNVPVKVEESGSLLFSFETGQMKESRPVAWQEIRGERVPVEVSFRVLEEKEVGFSVGFYDPEFPLVIDPVLTWNTFMGCGTGDGGSGIAVDTSGNVYVAGTSAATWGTPENPYAGNLDAFAAKLNSSGVRLWNTFMGSGLSDEGYGIAVDTSGNVYVTGSSNATWGTPKNAYAGNWDAFAAKLNSSGVRQWNTFMGSGSDDHGEGIAVDTNGNVYVTGYSVDTWGTPLNAHAGGAYDGFAAKLDINGNRLANTFMGSAGYDQAKDIAVDTSGNVYVTGDSAATWGTPENAYAGNTDAFAVKLGQPEINIKYDATNIPDGGSYDFGSHEIGTDTDVAFTIENIGTANLTLGTPLSLGGADADQFSIQQQPTSPVSASGNTTFIVRFTPTSAGSKTASLSISNNDTDENPYNLTLTAGGTKPEINLKHGATGIADGGNYDFGSHDVGTDTDVAFTIENIGTANLTLGTPISLGGADASQFSIQQQPSSPVSASGNTTFTIRFTPTSLGSKTASLSITNNDADENPYNLILTAGGTVPGLEEGKIRIQAGNDGWANPLRGENVNIYLKPKHSGNVSIEIYTIAGQLVWDKEISVTGGVQEQVVWNCRNKSDEVVSSGIYVVHVKGGGIDMVKKVAVVK